jgi:hypothetical protein
VDAAEVSHEVNQRIYELAVRYGSDLDVHYLCECGCMQWVRRWTSEYPNIGSLLPDHERTAVGSAS